MNHRLPAGVVLPERPGWPVTLRAGAVVLRPLHRRDAARWAELRERNREWTGPWDATPPPTRADPSPTPSPDFGATIRRLDRRAKQGTTLPFAICFDPQWPERESRPGRLPMGGQLTVNNIVLGSARFASVGYWVDRALAGRGVVPTALALAMDHCFQVLELHRVEVNIRPENTKSLRVVQKLGMRDEGLRPRFLHIDGDWRDHRSFALCDEDVPEGVLNRYLRSHPLPGAR